jgi:hypothetical protein
MHERVVQQRRDHLREAARGHVGLQAGLAHQDHLAAGAAEGGLPFGHLLQHDAVDADERRGPGRDPARGRQQLGDDLGQPLRLGERGGGLFPDHVRVAGGDHHLLQPHRQRGERSAQLVGGIDGELAVRGEQDRDPAGGAVETVGDAVQFPEAVALADRARVTGAEAAGRLGEFLDRAGRALGDDPGQARRQHHGEGEQGHAHRQDDGVANGREDEQRDVRDPRRDQRHRGRRQPEVAAERETVLPARRPVDAWLGRRVMRRGVVSRQCQSPRSKRNPTPRTVAMYRGW